MLFEKKGAISLFFIFPLVEENGPIWADNKKFKKLFYRNQIFYTHENLLYFRFFYISNTNPFFYEPTWCTQ